MFARIGKFFAPPDFKGDEDKTRRGRLLNAVLLLDTAGMSLMTSIDLLSGNIPAHVLFLEVTAILVLVALRIPMHRGKITEASYGSLVLFLIITSAALVSLGTTRDPTLGAFILLVVTAGLLLNRRAILVITGGCILAVSALMIAERAGRLRAPRMTIELSDWGTITVLLIVSAWVALWFRESIEKSLFRARQELAERIRAEEALRLSAVQLRRTLKEAINSLSSAIEMRDPYTAGHQERVTKLAEAIAQEMHLSEESIETLRIAGIIHDIGKLNVPSEILSKPSRLSEVELSMIKTHAEAGYMILSKIDFPWPVARIVYEHHERIDRSGYPRGLSGIDLLTESKILSLADVVEAMSSHRPYRPALGIEVALREISEKRGILYDPDVVEACLKLFADNKFRF